MTSDDTIRFARTFFWASWLIVVGSLVGVAVQWPIHPYVSSWGVTFLEIAVWFSYTAWLCRRPPYHGLMTFLFGLFVWIAFKFANAAAAYEQAAWPVAIGLFAFTALGLLIMLVAKISTDTQFRRPYWEEAMPGLVLVIASVIAVVVVATQLPGPPPVYLPAAVPAEGV